VSWDVPTLPEPWNRTYEVQPATAETAEELHELFVAHRMRILGFCRITVAEVRSWLLPRPDLDGVDLVVRQRDSGLAVQWWNGSHEHGDPRYFCLVTTHPDLPQGEADQLWSAGWAWLRRWVGELSDGSGPGGVVRSACVLGDRDNQRRLGAAGFIHERTYWEMAGPVSAGVRTEVPGLAIRGCADLGTVHALIQRGFRDHWDFHPQPLDEWLATERAAPGFEPAWWFLGELDGAPAAAMILCRYDDALYVQELATLPEFRRRGIASALLAHAFVVARESGYREVMLHVDSENVDGAPRIYRGAGLQVRHATLQHVLPLPR
jgi:ribosomal protein S18 acetylase RimI-like enzyme